MGQIDALMGIVICLFVSIFSQIVFRNLNIRFEIAILILFLIKLGKIKEEWENATAADD